MVNTSPELLQSTIAHFETKLRCETDPSDVAARRAAGLTTVLVDVRSREAWDQGHIPGAIHMPSSEVPERYSEIAIPGDADSLVVYCWGPGCNGSTKAALAFSRRGYLVKEMIGGFEYWAREGFAIEGVGGRSRRAVDDLTAPVPVGSRVSRVG